MPSQEAERRAKRPKLKRRKSGAPTAKQLEAEVEVLKATLSKAQESVKMGLLKLNKVHEDSTGTSQFVLWRQLSPESLEGLMPGMGTDVSNVIDDFLDTCFEPPAKADAGSEAEEDGNYDVRSELDEPVEAEAEPVEAEAEPVPLPAQAQQQVLQEQAAQEEGVVSLAAEQPMAAEQSQSQQSQSPSPSPASFPNGPATPSEAEATQIGASVGSTTTHADGHAGRASVPIASDVNGLATSVDTD